MKILEVENVKKVFRGGVVALDDVSFFLEKGDFLVLAGSNGSGKSVLMSLIAGLDEATSGKITVSSDSVGLVFQDADCQILGETVEEDVSFGAKNCGFKKDELKKRVFLSLEKVGLENKIDANSRTLSGGEKRRLAVAGILAMERDFLIFDEPFSNLDWPGVRQVCAMLKELKKEGKTIIVLTHELEKIVGLANRFIVLDQGKMRFNGLVEDGLKENLEAWGIKNPLKNIGKNASENEKISISELVWL